MPWLRWPVDVVGTVCWFVWQMAVSNARAVAVITGLRRLPEPLVVRLPTRARAEWEVALLSVLVSLTPGTLVLATRREAGRWVLYVHDMYAGDRRRSLSGLTALHERVLSATRPSRGKEKEL